MISVLQAGHLVTVFERNDRIGGLLRYGIPTMKLGKDVSILNQLTNTFQQIFMVLLTLTYMSLVSPLKLHNTEIIIVWSDHMLIKN